MKGVLMRRGGFLGGRGIGGSLHGDFIAAVSPVIGSSKLVCDWGMGDRRRGGA
jgi:hypothetical protein